MPKTDERMIVLKNMGPVPFQLVLHHDVVCATRQKCTCKTTYAPGDVKPKPIRAEASVRILVKDKSPLLPSAVLHLPLVKSALKKRPPVLEIEATRTDIEEV